MKKITLLAIASIFSLGALINCGGNHLIDGEDRDCDGLLNDIDPDPTNNHYQVELDLGDEKRSKPIDINIDYRDFLADGYNKNLALFTSLLLNSPIFINNAYEPAKKEILPIYAQIGCHDIKKMVTEGVYKNDPYDIAFAYLGHHTFTNADNKRYQFFFITINGYPTNTGWVSNFDIGACDASGNITQGYKDFWGVDEHPEWKNHKNHKGFDVAANRVIELVDKYVKEHEDSSAQKVMIFTGHSRGGAIANLVAKSYVDDGVNVKAYSFNPPTVTKENNDKEKYHNIFTFSNANDIVSRVPCPNYWGYSYFGVPFTIDVQSEGKDLYKNLYDRDYWGNSNENLDAVEKELADLSCLEAPTSNRSIKELAKSENLYENYHYSVEGEDENTFDSESEAIDFVNFISEHCSNTVALERDGCTVTWKCQGSAIIRFLEDVIVHGRSFDEITDYYLVLFDRIINDVGMATIIAVAISSIDPHAEPITCVLAMCENKKH
ncbi:MAG: hypothetical protein MJ214_04495 [Bacilli bacterium]|nr:hypothetical protein [Bacilli bacterium]